MSRVDHIVGQTFHGRKGAVKNAFRYRVDYLLLEAEGPVQAPRLFGCTLFARNRAALMSLWDADHGGAPGQGRGAIWLREMLAAHGLPAPDRIELLAQPRVLGHVFNPVAFWLCHADGLRVVVAEVTNTYGDRHCYLCHRPDLAPITAADWIEAQKVFHVSPFQPIEGSYRFRFDITAERIGIWIDHSNGTGGIYTNLTGPRRALTARSLLAACLRRPFGSRRVLALIHWQALRLFLKGAGFRNRPKPPAQEISR